MFDYLFLSLFCQSSLCTLTPPSLVEHSPQNYLRLRPQSVCPIKQNSQLIYLCLFSSQHHQTTFDNPEVKYFLKQGYIYHFFKWKNHNIIFYHTTASGAVTGSWANLSLCLSSFSNPMASARWCPIWQGFRDLRSTSSLYNSLVYKKQKNFCIFWPAKN